MFNTYIYNTEFTNMNSIVAEEHFPWFSIFLLKCQNEDFARKLYKEKFNQILYLLNQRFPEEEISRKTILDSEGNIFTAMFRFDINTLDYISNHLFSDWFFRRRPDIDEILNINSLLEFYYRNDYLESFVKPLIQLYDGMVIDVVPFHLACYLKKEKRYHLIPFNKISNSSRNYLLDSYSDSESDWNLELFSSFFFKKHYDKDYSDILYKALEASKIFSKRMKRAEYDLFLKNEGNNIISNFLHQFKINFSHITKEEEIYTYNFNVYNDEIRRNETFVVELFKDPDRYKDTVSKTLRGFKLTDIDLIDQNIYCGRQYLLMNELIIRLLIIPDHSLKESEVETYNMSNCFKKATYIATVSKRANNDLEKLYYTIPSKKIENLSIYLEKLLVKFKNYLFTPTT